MIAARKFMRLFLYAICGALLTVSLYAQVEGLTHYSSQQWDLSDGLPHVSVQTVLQTHDGYLWVGTLKGLARFNGNSFSTLELATARELEHNRITALCETSDHTLWIGSYNGLLVRLQNGKISGLLTNAPFKTEAVLDIYEAHDGTVWIGTIGGVLRYKNGSFSRFSRDHLLGRVSVKKFCEDSSHQLWLGTSAGLVRFTEESTHLYGIAEGLTPDFVRAVCCARDGTVWFGTSSALAHLENGVVRQYTKKDGLADVNITSLYEDRSGTLWIGTFGGLNRRTGTNFIAETTSERDPYDQVYSVTEDKEGNIWVAAKDGLYRLKQKQFATYTSQQGLAHNNVTCVHENADGAVWFGTWGGGLHRLKDGKLTVFNWSNGNPFGNDMILSMCETRDGALWLGNDFDGGLFRFKDGLITRMEKKDFDERAIRAICQDRSGTLWIGASTGLEIFKDGHFQRFGIEHGLPSVRIRAVEQDRMGRIWIGTERGVVVWDEASARFRTPAQLSALAKLPVVEVFQDTSGALWFGTLGSGVFHWNEPNLVHYTTEHGMPSDDVYEIIEDDQGNFWFTCLKGVFSISHDAFSKLKRNPGTSLSFILHDKNDGMVSSQCNGSSKPAAWKSKDGRLWFGTSKGLSMIKPTSDTSRASTDAPPVFIEQLSAGKKKLLMDPIFANASPLQIEPGLSEIEFHFAALSFRAPERNRFRYKLQGIDADWIDAQSSRSVTYKGIRPGEYRFQVIAANSDGVWNTKGASASFVLLPYFWQTWWFVSATIVAGLLCLGAAVRYTTTKNLQRRLETLERQNAIQRERTRIAQDMHDDLGARLTEILFLSDVVADEKRKPDETRGHMKRISNAARELVRNLDVIVWALNPKNDSLDNFALYVYEHVENFLAPTGIRCRLDVPDELPNVVLSSEVRHNLFLVMKEALNNIAKHSCATEAWFRLRFEKNMLSIAIEDNGKGFAEERTTSLGNGLVNMEKRMESIGGCLGLKTSRGNGTYIRLQLPLRHT